MASARLFVLPALAVSWVFSSFYTANIFNGVSALEVFLTCVATMAAFAIGFFVSRRFVRDRQRYTHAMAWTIFALFFFSFRLAVEMASFAGSGSNYLIMPIWGVLLLASLALAIVLKPGRRAVSICVIALVAMNAAVVADGLYKHYQLIPRDNVVDDRGEPDQDAMLVEAIDIDPVDTLPNIYHVVLDSYGRSDVIEHLFGYDNLPTMEALRRSGFVIGRGSYANYSSTIFSLSAMLQMDYPVEPTDGSWFWDQRIRSMANGRNVVVSTLRSLGYGVTTFVGNRYDTAMFCSGFEDTCLRCDGLLNDLRVQLLLKTPISAFLSLFSPGWHVNVQYDCDLGDLGRIAQDAFDAGEAPANYLFAHFLAMHNPLNVDASCNRLENPETEYWIALPEQRELAVEQFGCIDLRMIEFINDIEARDPSAIIIIHGDHGTDTGGQAGMLVSDWDDAAIEERMAILLAVRLPEACRDGFYETMTPVNVFRLVFSCLEGRAPTFAEDRSFILNNHPNYIVREVEF